MGLKPKVKIVCPECDMSLKFTCYIRNENDVNWVLSVGSRKHLAEEHLQRPLLTIVPSEVAEPYLAA